MYVCICEQVTDSQIKQAIDNGAETMRDLRSELGVASQCGQCGRCAKSLLKEHAPKRSYSKQLASALPVFPIFEEPLLARD